MEAELLQFISQGMTAPPDDAAFNRLAMRLHRWQYQRNPVLRSYWDEMGTPPGRVADWREVPPLPAVAFKATDVACGDPAQAVRTFLSSGTTRGPEQRSRHHFFTLALYRAAAVPPFVHYLLPDGARLPILALAPPPEDAPDSSLSWYLGVILAELGAPGSRFFWHDGGLPLPAVHRALCEAAAAGGPVLLVGTAFAFVHMLDSLPAPIRLPAGSRAMETGGFKGRSREMPQPELYALIAARLGISVERIVNQYGMTELSSNFYEPVLRQARAAPPTAGFPRPKQGPPWTRVLIRDPETMAVARPGEPGLIEVVDLANLGSAGFILTQDLGRETPDGFMVLGRAPGAVPRGCSIAADLAMGAGQ